MVSGTTHPLHWLPEDRDWRSRFKRWRERDEPSRDAWTEAVELAGHQLDFTMTNALDAAVRALFTDGAPKGVTTRPVRLAVLSSSTVNHLHASIRVAALRRGIWVSTYEANYGQYWTELLDPASDLHRFAPDAVLFAFDAHHLTAATDAAMEPSQADDAIDGMMAHIADCWRLAREAFHCPIFQQSAFDIFPALLGNNEHRLPGSRSSAIARLNAAIRVKADDQGVDIVAVDRRQMVDGIAFWFNPALWHRAKQEVAPGAAPLYGDLVARLLAARQGRSFKCLALDLDNTLWGGVIGDDGMDGIILGQGSATGEAFVALQDYARRLAQRGVILAVCSKNDDANAREPFEKHPDMLLRLADIGCFVANWSDKPGNLRRIAEELNIGIDAIVFLDDNPFERALVRRELPMVAVPEVSEDPALMAQAIADAGYFEATVITADDRARSSQYRLQSERKAMLASATDLDSYLRDLEMRLVWSRFDELGLQRIVQLINKTNQFNLTTRRYTEDEARAVMADDRAVGLQLRLTDRFGDNGIIAIVIGRLDDQASLVIDSWLMSCRVLGRQVEQATLAVLIDVARTMGAKTLTGEYVPSPKNAMVRDHYARLGFQPAAETMPASPDRMQLSLAEHRPVDLFMEIVGDDHDR